MEEKKKLLSPKKIDFSHPKKGVLPEQKEEQE
jgi:hypothetical protein